MDPHDVDIVADNAPAHRAPLVNALIDLGAFVVCRRRPALISTTTRLPWDWGWTATPPFGEIDVITRFIDDTSFGLQRASHDDPTAERLYRAVPSDVACSMSELTGLGLLDLAILEACEHAGAGSGSPYLRTQKVLDVLGDQTGIGPYHAYEPLCDMARPWTTHLALIDFHGNYGSPDFGAAGPRYTECRLTPLGAGALASERHLIGALPVGLINGNTHTGGPQPPLEPQRVMSAIRSVSTASNHEIASIIGLPSFPTGCVVVGDLDAFASGSETQLQLAARVTELAADQLLISHLPPHCSASDIANSIQSRLDMTRRFPEYANEGASLPAHLANLPPIRGVNDQSSVLEGSRLVVTVERGSNLAHARVFLNDIHGVKTTINARLPQPIAELVRAFTGTPTGDMSE